MSIEDMSIEDEIRARVSEGRLRLAEPILKGASSRALFVEGAVYARLSEDATSGEGYRIGLLMRDLDRFSSGRRITIGYGQEKTCFMKHLHPLADEVWEIRSRDPNPGYRLFCRFAAPDVLVVLGYGPRKALGRVDSPAWQAAIRNCKAQWRSLFLTYLPFSGKVASDYIQRNVLVVGDIP